MRIKRKEARTRLQTRLSPPQGHQEWFPIMIMYKKIKHKQQMPDHTPAMRCASTRNAEESLARAIYIFLKAARDASQSKDTPAIVEKREPPSQAPAQDALTTGTEASDSHGGG